MKVIIFIRALVTTVFFTIFTMCHATIGIALHFIFRRRKIDNWIMRFWGKVACFVFNYDLKVYGLENYTSVKGAIILFNHASFADVFALAASLNSLRFGAKIELFKVPVFGHCMRSLGNIPIARNNREEVFRVYEEAKIRFKRGEKFGLSPEGGRHIGEDLGAFKSGPFVFAINSQVPLVPVVIKGAVKAWPKGSFLANPFLWRARLELHVLPPVSTQGLTLDDRGALQAQLYKMMNDVYKVSHL